KLRQDSGNIGIFPESIDQGISLLLKLSETHPAAIFDHDFEAGRNTQSRNWSGPKHLDIRIAYFDELATELRHNRIRGKLGILSLCDRFKESEARPKVGTVCGHEKRHPTRRCGMSNARCFKADSFDLGNKFLGPLQRCGIG